MASETIVGVDFNPAIDPREVQSVWLKVLWSDQWTYIPYLRPLVSKEVSAPGTSTASFAWDYGVYGNLWDDGSGNLIPWQIHGRYIRIQNHTAYGTHTTWIGIVDRDTQESEGNDATNGIPIGEQTIHAVGLETLLDRRRMIGTWWNSNYSTSTTRVFNRKKGRGMKALGNRSTSTEPVFDTYVFSDDDEEWSASQVMQYLLTFVQPATPQFLVIGQWAALNQIVQEWDFHGRTVRECFNLLIDNRRGLSWKIVTDGEGPIYIFVYSLMSEGVYAPSVNLPPNFMQVDVDFSDTPHVQVSTEVQDMNRVDRLIVESEEPIKTTFTLDGETGLLVKAWTDAEKTAYDDATPEERANDTISSKPYSHFKMTTDWDWTGIKVVVKDDGSVVLGDSSATVTNVGKSFLRELVLEDETGNSPDPELREPFAFIKLPKEDEDDEEEADRYALLDKLGGIGHPTASLRMADRGLELIVKTSANHTFAKGHIDEENKDLGKFEALFNYASLGATVCVEQDHMLRVIMYSADFGTNETAKELHIIVPGVECWTVAENTVLDINEDGTKSLQSANQILRNDIDVLRTVAWLAAAWYMQQRATAIINIENCLPWFGVGNLLRTVWYGAKWDWLGTPVTEIALDYTTQSQSIRTGWTRAEPLQYLKGIIGQETRQIRKRVSYVEQITGKLPTRASGAAGPTSAVVIDIVETLPAIPTSIERYVFWTSTGGGTGDDQIWVAYPGQERWAPTQRLTALVGTPGGV